MKNFPIAMFIPIIMLVSAALACRVPAQDCMGTTFNVEGFIVDEENNPVDGASIRAWNEGSFEQAAIDLRASTDAEGYFSTDSGFSYGCTSFQLEVIASGFATKTLTYYPPAGEGWPDELPDEITIQLQPIDN